MKERPILFSAPMVRAILAGTKTQTRRVVKRYSADCIGWFDDGDGLWAQRFIDPSSGRPYLKSWRDRCPYGQPGDRLWLRETYQRFSDDGEILYRADPQSAEAMNELKRDECLEARWRPAIFMPRWASRITLEITGVRVERLQDISASDSWAEGIPHSPDVDPVHEYRELWESINGPGSWDANPWVWCVEFKRVQQ